MSEIHQPYDSIEILSRSVVSLEQGSEFIDALCKKVPTEVRCVVQTLDQIALWDYQEELVCGSLDLQAMSDEVIKMFRKVYGNQEDEVFVSQSRQYLLLERGLRTGKLNMDDIDIHLFYYLKSVDVRWAAFALLVLNETPNAFQGVKNSRRVFESMEAYDDFLDKDNAVLLKKYQQLNSDFDELCDVFSQQVEEVASCLRTNIVQKMGS